MTVDMRKNVWCDTITSNNGRKSSDAEKELRVDSNSRQYRD